MAGPKGFLFDVTTCVLCGACYLADKERNNLPVAEGDFEKDVLSASSYLVVSNVRGRGVRFSCMHCLDPACVSVCPVGAFEKTAPAPVIYHQEKCIGCRYCMMACPFGVPKYEWSEPLPYVRKCDFCYDRLKNGQNPACSDACPTGAILFGDRDDLLMEAKRRIKADPKRYIDHVYGEKEIGGTSLLILSDIPLEKLGYPAGFANQPLPESTWSVLQKIPDAVSLASVLTLGIWYLTKRRQEVQTAEGTVAQAPPEHKNEEGK